MRIFTFLGIIEPILGLGKWSSAETDSNGCMQRRQSQCFHMKNLSETETPDSVLLCGLCFRGQPLQILFDFTAAGVNYSTAVVKSLLVLQNCSF